MLDYVLITNEEGEALVRRASGLDGAGQTRVKRAVTNFIKTRLLFGPLCSDPVPAPDPVVTHDGVTIHRVERAPLMLFAAQTHPGQPALAVAWLSQLADALELRFQDDPNGMVEAIQKESHVALAYLEESLEPGGHPLTSLEHATISSSSVIVAAEANGNDIIRERTDRLTGPHPWRAEGIQYRHNEVYLEIVERVHQIQNPQGKVLRSFILGSIDIKAKLTGTPLVTLGVNTLSTVAAMPMNSDQQARSIIAFEHCRFHHCVDLDSYHHAKRISFVPPSTPSKLVEYRTTIPPMAVPLLAGGAWETTPEGTLRTVIKVTSTLPAKVTAKNVEILIPLPAAWDRTPLALAFDADHGRAERNPAGTVMKWTVAKAPQEATLTLEVTPPSISEVRFPYGEVIKMNYEIQNYSASGLEIKFVHAKSPEDYDTSKWIRYTTMSGNIESRMTCSARPK